MSLFIKECTFGGMKPLKGKRVCDFGCDNGTNNILFAKLGASVEAFDLSPESTTTARGGGLRISTWKVRW